MKLKSFHMLCVVVILLMATACAHDPTEATPLEERLAQRGFVIGKQVNEVDILHRRGWSNVDREHVIFDFGVSRSYLLTLRTSCNSLVGAANIGFTAARYLSDKDKLLVRDSRELVVTCAISTIHELEKIDRTG